MSGIKDVAAKAGVSISTVSNVINKTKYVSPALIKRVEDAIEKLDYKANPIAASMKSKKTNTIGVITEDLCGCFYPYVLRGISDIADIKGYKIVICDVHGRTAYGKGIIEKSVAEREKELFDELINRCVDGIIFVSAVKIGNEKKYFEELKSKADNAHKAMPVVSLERDLTSFGIDSVYFETRKNSKKAVKHLIDSGCKKICFISGPHELQVAEDRYCGYIECMKENAMYLDENKMVYFGDYSHQSGYIGMEELLEKNPDLDGVFCANDQMAIGALKILKEKEKKIPDEVKIIGFDDVFVSNIVEPALSTIHVPKRAAGQKAAELLFDRIENKDEEINAVGIKLDSHLVVRKSSSHKAKEDWNLSEW